MASGTINGSTINGSTGNQYIDSKIEWSYTQNNSANTSTITAVLYYKRNNTGYQTQGTGTFSITIGGKKTSETKHLTITEDAWVKAVEGSATIEHNGDGTKSVYITSSGSISGTSLSSTNCSKTITLDTIPRASTITSASNRTLGKACAVKWTPLAKSFRYKLKFTLGDWSYTTGAIHPNTTSAYTYTGYTLPLTVANQLPKAKVGTMTVTLYTYSDSSATTQIGSSSSKNFTVTVPDSSATKPTVTMELEPVNSLGDTFSSLYIKGLSKVKATFSGEGKYSATISSYSMSVLGKSDTTSPYQSGYLSASGNVTVTGRATDSRGYYKETTQDITVIPYSKPKILPASDESEIICARCDEDGNLTESGTYLKIKARRSYAKVESSGVQKNFCAIRYRCVTEGDKFSGDDGWVTLLAGSTTSTDTVNKTLSGVVSSTQTAYVVQVGVVDDIGESAVVQYVIPTDFTTIDIPEEHKGRRIGIFRYAQDTEEDGMYVGLPIFGGSVDSLKLGTSLTATESSPINLNDVKTPGAYYSPGGTYSQYILNSPYTTGGFGLEVRELQSKNYIRQTMYYGRTTLIRHWDNSKWSDWLRYMTTEEVTGTAADFVVEQGSIDIWHYRKWHSGKAECWGKRHVTVDITTAWGTIFYGEITSVAFPFEFVSAPNCQVTAEFGQTSHSAWICAHGNTTKASAPAITMCRPETAEQKGFYILYYAMGEWK